jgi:uncharacterized membrane protein HdeD (DUF308 family)
MERYIKNIGRESIFISCLLIVISLFMILKPVTVLSVIIIMFGYILVADGLIHFVSYFSIRDEYRYFSYELAQAILDVILGFIVVCNVSSIEQVLPFVLGIWIILDGILKLQIAFNIRGIRDTKWGTMLAFSIISIVLGAAIMINPGSSMDIIIKLSGVVLLITQLFSIYDDVYILTQVKEVSNIVKDVTGEEVETEKKTKKKSE